MSAVKKTVQDLIFGPFSICSADSKLRASYEQNGAIVIAEDCLGPAKSDEALEAFLAELMDDIWIWGGDNLVALCTKRKQVHDTPRDILTTLTGAKGCPNQCYDAFAVSP